MADTFVSLNYAGYGALSYAFFHILHVLVWRLGKIQTGIRLLFALLLGIPSLLYLNLILKVGLAWAVPGLVHVLLAANYIAIYPAFQASSPTIQLLAFLWKVKRSVREDELVSHFGTQDVIAKRMEDLTVSGLVRLQGSEMELSPKARWLATFFIFYRRALGLPRGIG
jgi:hypothetical protein